jgi:hypothetical protein
MSPQLTHNDQSSTPPCYDPCGLERVQTDRHDWLVVDAWRDRILGPVAPDWFALGADPRAERAKEGAGRVVWRVQLDGCVVYAKVFEAQGLLQAVKRWALGDPARREMRSGHRAERGGVAVVRFVAAGVDRRRRWRSVLVSEGITDAVALTEAWHESVAGLSGTARRRAVERLAEPVAHLYAGAHHNGFVDLDGHPNNVLVFGDASQRLHAVFVDLHAARLSSSPVSRRRVATALGQLEHVFRRTASRSERLRFLRRYLGLRGMSPPHFGDRELRCLVCSVLAARARQARRLARTRDSRLRRDGKYFATVRLGGGWTAKVALALERRHLFAELSVPDRAREQWVELLGGAIARSCAHGAPANVAAPGIRCLVHRAGPVVMRLGWTLGGSPARAAFERCHRLRHRDVAAPLVLGYAERRRAGLIDAAIEILPRDPHLEALAEAPTDPRFAPATDRPPEG